MELRGETGKFSIRRTARFIASRLLLRMAGKTRSARVHWRISDRSQPDLATPGVAKRLNVMSHEVLT